MPPGDRGRRRSTEAPASVWRSQLMSESHPRSWLMPPGGEKLPGWTLAGTLQLLKFKPLLGLEVVC